MSLSYRGATIVTIPALCLLATLGTWLYSRSLALDIIAKIDRSQARISNTKELLFVMLNAETGVRGYLVSGDPEFLEPYQVAQKSLPIALSNLQESLAESPLPGRIGNDPQKLAKLDLIRSRVKSIQKLMAVQITDSAPAREGLLKQSKREMDALRQAIDAAQAIEQVFLARQRNDLSDLQSLIQSLQQLFTVTGIMSTAGGIYLFQLLERELRQREAQIQTRDSFINTLTTDIIDGVSILDRSGQIETVNPALIEMLGYTAVDLLECTLMRLFTAPTTPQSQPLPELVTWLKQQPKLGRSWQITAYRRDGTSLPVELSLSEIHQENRFSLGAGFPRTMAIVRDVSEQANLTRQLKTNLKAVEKLNLALIATNFALNSRNQELAEFAYVTAHDLKTPLRGIATLSEWIEEEVRPYSSKELDLNIQLLRQRTYRLNTLIDGLWEYTNLGQTTVTPEPIHLTAFLLEIQANFPLLPNFEIEIHPTDLELIACKSHLGKVLEELLENAVKHHHLGCGKVEISAHLIADKIEFTIADNGPGIAPEHQQRVFRLFETLQPGGVQENAGIGLAIAKKLIDRVGGKIWLENPDSGKGLAVHFTWPQFPPG